MPRMWSYVAALHPPAHTPLSPNSLFPQPLFTLPCSFFPSTRPSLSLFSPPYPISSQPSLASQARALRGLCRGCARDPPPPPLHRALPVTGRRVTQQRQPRARLQEARPGRLGAAPFPRAARHRVPFPLQVGTGPEDFCAQQPPAKIGGKAGGTSEGEEKERIAEPVRHAGRAASKTGSRTSRAWSRSTRQPGRRASRRVPTAPHLFLSVLFLVLFLAILAFLGVSCPHVHADAAASSSLWTPCCAFLDFLI